MVKLCVGKGPTLIELSKFGNNPFNQEWDNNFHEYQETVMNEYFDDIQTDAGYEMWKKRSMEGRDIPFIDPEIELVRTIDGQVRDRNSLPSYKPESRLE